MRCFFLIVVLWCCALAAFSQQYPDSLDFRPKYRHGVKYQFKTSAGTVFSGFVVNETPDIVTIENREVHEIYDLKRSEIVEARAYSDRQAYTDLVLGENEHARNYMLTQSALLFREGKLSSTSHFLLVDNMDYAFSKNWAVTVNTLAFFYPMSIGIKCAYAIDENNYVGGNLFGVGNLGTRSNGSLLFGYGFMGKFTRGNSNNNFTITGGVLGLTSDLFVNPGASSFVNLEFGGLSLCRRVSKRVAVVGEALYFPSVSFGLAGAAIKLVSNPISCWTLGCFSVLSQYNNSIQVNFKNLPIPYFGVSRNF